MYCAFAGGGGWRAKGGGGALGGWPRSSDNRIRWLTRPARDRGRGAIIVGCSARFFFVPEKPRGKRHAVGARRADATRRPAAERSCGPLERWRRGVFMRGRWPLRCQEYFDLERAIIRASVLEKRGGEEKKKVEIRI